MNHASAPADGSAKVGGAQRVSLPRRIAAFPIRVYMATLSWFLGGQCRFTPTCSRYGLEAVETHGPLKGWWMALKRICRCHPFHPGGYDPVPPCCDGTEHERQDAAQEEKP